MNYEKLQPITVHHSLQRVPRRGERDHWTSVRTHPQRKHIEIEEENWEAEREEAMRRWEEEERERGIVPAPSPSPDTTPLRTQVRVVPVTEELEEWTRVVSKQRRGRGNDLRRADVVVHVPLEDRQHRTSNWVKLQQPQHFSGTSETSMAAKCDVLSDKDSRQNMAALHMVNRTAGRPIPTQTTVSRWSSVWSILSLRWLSK